MRRSGKFFKTTLLVVVMVALVAVGLKALLPFNNPFDEMNATARAVAAPFAGHGQVQVNVQEDWHGGKHVQVVANGKQFNAGPDQHRFEQAHMAMKYDRHHDHGFGFGEFLFSLLLLFVGWKLWKRGGVARWIGALLMAVVLLPLLGAVLSVLIPVAALYLIWRWARRRKRQDAMAFVGSEPEYKVPTVDFLDEWENKIRNQLKNKEEL